MSMSGFGGGMSTALRLDKYVLPNHMDLCSPCYNTRASDRMSAESGRSVVDVVEPWLSRGLRIDGVLEVLV